MLTFWKNESNFKVKVRSSKIKVPTERSCHNEIPITYHLKDMANFKVFADRKTN
jgi:hypothetical protein